MATNYWAGFVCPVCDEGFTLAQWEARHNGRNGEEYHGDCCPECKEDMTTIDDEEETDEEFIGWLYTGYFDDWLEDVRQSLV